MKKEQIKKRIEELENKVEKLKQDFLPEMTWQKIGELKWSKNLGEMDWYEANKKCEELGGRLPTRLELIDLVDNHAEEIEDWDKKYHFWSSTELSYNSDYAWSVGLNLGYTYGSDKTNSSYYARCVCR